MSTPISLGNFKSKANQENQFERYRQQLQLQMRLQRGYEEANQMAYRDGGIPSRPPEINEFKSAEEATQSAFEQRKVLKENLKKLFKFDKDLLTALDLIPIEEAGDFNQAFGLFAPTVSSIANLTPEMMLEAWTRFKREKIRKSKGKTVRIGVDETGRRVQLEQLANALTILANRISNPSARRSRIEEIEEALEADDLERLIEMSKQQRQTISLGAKKQIQEEESSASYAKLIKDLEEGEEKAYNWSAYAKQNKLGSWQQSRGTQGRYLDTLILFYTLEKNLSPVQQEQLLKSKDQLMTIKQATTIRNKMAKILGEQAVGKKEGSGLKRGRKPNKYIIGSGIEVEPEVKFVQFGKYLIDKPALYSSQPKLQVKYPSKAMIREFPNQMITAELARIIKSILEEKKVNFKSIQDLPHKEQLLLNTLLEKAKLNQQLGLAGMRDEELERESKQFEMLRGQVLAGNNSPQMLKNLKTMILKFMADGRMPKSQGNQLLFEIQTLI